MLDPLSLHISNNKARRSEPNNASRRKTVYWSQFFALASPVYAERAQIVRDKDRDLEVSDRVDESKCVTCPKGGELVCIGTTHYGFCDEGCAEPRRLMEGARCVDGRIFRI
jgi:hypothetical protein